MLRLSEICVWCSDLGVFRVEAPNSQVERLSHHKLIHNSLLRRLTELV